jgi:hypothetical protein
VIGVWKGRAFLAALAPLWRRPRELVARVAAERSELPLVLGLAVASAAWWVVVIVETEDHYPGLQRFYLPAAAMICVLSGYALVQVAVWVGNLLPGRPLRRSVAGLAVAVALCVGSWHWLSVRWGWARAQEPLARLAVSDIDQLGRSVKVLGGIRKILPCPSSVITINHSLQTAMAWELGTDLEKVQTVLRTPGLAWVTSLTSVTGSPPPIAFKFSTLTVATVGVWSIQQVFPYGGSPGRCVGA